MPEERRSVAEVEVSNLVGISSHVADSSHVGDWILTITGAGENPILVRLFLEITREFPKIITSTGAKIW